MTTLARSPRARPVPPGLTQAEAERRAAAGRANASPRSSRPLLDILRANLLTRFNALLGVMLVVILAVGPPQDAVFGLILALNAGIGIAQELRARSTLERLAILAAPAAHAVRDGQVRRLRAADVVDGDLLELRAGDEVVADGELVSDEPLGVDESLLTGEATAQLRRRGERLLAGSLVVAGSGRLLASAVGSASYAGRVTREASSFRLVRSELMEGINRILRVVTWLMAPVAGLLVISQLRANPDLAAAARASVAGVVTLVPEGLVLLTSASLALAVIRLGRRRVLVQQLSAVEMLARADVVCFDKTGTLTEPAGRLVGARGLGEAPDWERALAALGAADPAGNATIRAVAEAYPADPGWVVERRVQFDSARKWSGVRFRDQGWWVLGAPDRLLRRGEDRILEAEATGGAAGGRRVLLLARAGQVSTAGVAGLRPAALLDFAEEIRPDARDTIRELSAAGLALKVLSGDHPATVASIAERAGMAVGSPIDCSRLEAGAPLAELAATATVFGRVSPEQKRELVRALRAQGHTVAMVGDGVNDLLALKEADLGVAVGGGSSAARAVAAVVLVDGSFAGLPPVLAEGRRVIGNVERLASLFFTKTVYAIVLATAVGALVLPFPFLPRQLTLVSAFTIGIPSAFIALSRGFDPARGDFLRRVLAFSLPAGLVAGLATFAAYALAVAEPDLAAAEERTLATIVIAAVGLWVLGRLVSPLTLGRRVLLLGMAAGLMVVLAVPSLRWFFDLDLPRPLVALAGVGTIAIALTALEAGSRAAGALAARWPAWR